MGTLRFGMRAFFVGLVIGLLVAPRPGWQSRRMLRERFLQVMDAIAELLALPQEPISLPDRAGTRGA
jgi:hypothetical protein